MELVVVPDPLAAAAAAAEKLANIVEACCKREGECALALSAGGQCQAVYELFARFLLPWAEVEFFFTEERCVPSDHPASCYGLAMRTLFQNPLIGLRRVHPVYAERPAGVDPVEEYDAECPERFDAMLLDLGLDGHVASLFAHSTAFDVEGRRAVEVESPMKPRKRVTITPVMIASAQARVVVACGVEKAPVLKRVLEGEQEPRELPGALARDSLWVVDRRAASMLERQGVRV